jgi:hypothetical protein
MSKSSQNAIFYGNALVKTYDDSRKTLAVDIEGNSFLNITGATTKVVCTGAGVLEGISINTNGGTVVVYDGLNTSGTKIASFATDLVEAFFPLHVAFTTGLTVVLGATVDVTVIYRGASATRSSSSTSPSTSVSPSVSASVSPSTSVSPSVSASVSPSTSVSASRSSSVSPSVSTSVSHSASASASKSVSPSASASASKSPSDSSSPSGSASPSASPSGMV